MRFAIQHSIGDPNWRPACLAPETVADFARRSESCGFDAIAFTDHPAPSSRWIDHGGEGVADPFSSLGFCAALTSRIRLLTFVMVPAYRNPFLLAHQIATLDALSGGRVTIGVGTGYLFPEFRALGVDPGERLARFDENVELMRRAWAGETIKAEVGTIAARDTKVIPPITQVPHPPIWIHGNSSFGLERTVRYGSGWLAMMTSNEAIFKTIRTRAITDTAALARRISDLRNALDTAGRDPSEVTIAVSGMWPILDIRNGASPAGYLDQVAELESLGVEWLISTICGDDPAAARDTLDHFGENVIAVAQPG